jgi:NAD(P)-dependent dehydrogenase (short-subunit alcohol dehydrogenase family)
LVVDMSEDSGTAPSTSTGRQLSCARALSHPCEAKERRIISIARHCALRREGIRPYAASKAAIIGFVKALAREVGTDGSTVNAICPGAANTAMPRTHRSEEELMARLRSNPLGHVLEPEDFVGPILFLASDAASYITGQAINVNCGSYMI